MGYTTDFNGRLKLNKRPTKKQVEYLEKFTTTRRMGRDVKVLIEQDKGENGLPQDEEPMTMEQLYGNDGEYYVGDDNLGVIDINTPPGQLSYHTLNNFNNVYDENRSRIQNKTCQPGLWCNWEVNSYDETTINEEWFLEWNGAEKFYDYVEWLEYMVDHFFKGWGITLNGEIFWNGEDRKDFGKIVVVDNVITVLEGEIIYR